MKKVIAILAVLMLVAGAVFAATTIKVQSKVISDDPVFLLRAGLNPNSYNTAISGDETRDVIGWSVLGKSIKDDNIEVFFQIIQSGKAGKENQQFKLNVSATKMIQVKTVDGDALPATKTPYEASQGIISEETAKDATNVTVSKTAAGEFRALYSGRVEDNTPLATFKVVWAQDDDAEEGIYEATVKLEVTNE